MCANPRITVVCQNLTAKKVIQLQQKLKIFYRLLQIFLLKLSNYFVNLPFKFPSIFVKEKMNNDSFGGLTTYELQVVSY